MANQVKVTPIFVGFLFCVGLSAAVYCPEGFTKRGRYCYKVVSARVSWWTAVHRCHQQGGHLADIKSSTEQRYIEGLIQHALTYRAHFAGGVNFWIGGTDQRQESVWRWESDGSRITRGVRYTNWITGEPNNLKGREHCMALWGRHGHNYRWNDESCGAHLNYICEIKV